MKLVLTSVTDFEGTDYEKSLLPMRIEYVVKTGNWYKIYYKMPKDRKVYSVFLKGVISYETL